MEVLAEISGHVESKWLLNTTHSILTSLWRPHNKFVPLTITGSSVYDEGGHRAVLIPPSALSLCLQSQTRKAETEAAHGLCIFLQQAQHTVWVPVGGTAGAWNTQMGLIPPSQKPCIAPVLSSITSSGVRIQVTTKPGKQNFPWLTSKIITEWESTKTGKQHKQVHNCLFQQLRIARRESVFSSRSWQLCGHYPNLAVNFHVCMIHYLPPSRTATVEGIHVKLSWSTHLIILQEVN